MSKNLFPIPVTTPIMQDAGGNQFGITWQKYLKSVGDDLLTANRLVTSYETTPDPDNAGKVIKKANGLKYTVNGNVCFCAVELPNADGTQITLPYTSAVAFQVQSTVFPAGTKFITIPSGVPFCQFWYFVDFG